MASTPDIFPDRLIRELEASRDKSWLHVAAAARILYVHWDKLDDPRREALWRLLPELRKHTSRRVRFEAMGYAFKWNPKKDVFPLFVEFLEDTAPVEGVSASLALQAIAGVKASGKCSPAAVDTILRYLDSPDKALRHVAAGHLPAIAAQGGDVPSEGRVSLS